jgi:hypothetical protein
VTAELDPVQALNGIIEITGRFGAEQPAGLVSITGDDAKRVAAATRSAKLEVVSDKEDFLLQALDLAIVFEASSPELEADLQSLSGVTFQMTLQIEDHNDDIQVEAPDAPLPYSELPAAI